MKNKKKLGYTSIEILFLIGCVLLTGITGITKVVNDRDIVSNELEKTLSTINKPSDNPGGGSGGITPTPTPPSDVPLKNCVYDGDISLGVKFELYPYSYSPNRRDDTEPFDFLAHYIGNEKVVVDPPCTSINNGLVPGYLFHNQNLDIVDLSKFINIPHSFYQESGIFYGSTIKTVKMKGFTVPDKTQHYNKLFNGATIENLDLTGWKLANSILGGYSMFSRFTGNINFGDFDTSSFTNTASMFYSATIENLDVSSFNTENVLNMEAMFHNLNTSILTIGNLNSTKVTTMNNMFTGLQTKELDLSQFNIPATATVADLFKDSTVETVYVMNQENLDRIRASSNLPSTINFIIK